MKTKEVMMALNGKKLPIALAFTIFTGGLGYGQLKGNVKNNAEQIDKLDKVPEQIASIETDIENIKEGMQDFKLEQREMRTDIKTILREVTK